MLKKTVEIGEAQAVNGSVTQFDLAPRPFRPRTSGFETGATELLIMSETESAHGPRRSQRERIPHFTSIWFVSPTFRVVPAIDLQFQSFQVPHKRKRDRLESNDDPLQRGRP